MTPPIPLSLSRRSCVGGTNAPHIDIPLSGAATWSPADGLRIHDALDVAAAYVVTHGGSLTVRTEPHPWAGQIDAETGLPWPDTQCVPVTREPPYIIATGAGLPGLTCAEEAALLERARAAL
jgi:hypothetical protein